MLDEEYIEIARMQSEKAGQLLSFIPAYIEIGDYATAVNRAYYAAFHVLKALESLTGYDSKNTAAHCHISEGNISKHTFCRTISPIS